jgi:phosphate transport system substrate-binding protein
MRRVRTERIAKVALGAWVALSFGGAAIAATPVGASGPTVSGAGSTWVQIALDQWRADFAQQGYSINYQGVGSSTGRAFYIANQVDFAATEIPFYPAELQQIHQLGKSFQYLPDVAGGTSLMYNVHAPDGSRITNLNLDARTAAGIFTGGITKWQDPAIQALNPGRTISETDILPVIRSDGSGTSAQFSLYLASQASSVWGPFASANGCPAPCSVWPAFAGSTQQSGSDGVANFVANDAIGAGSIGYVEAGYAFGRAFPIANLRNASGHYVPGQNNPVVFSYDVATALKHATLYPDLTQNLSGVYAAPEANAYPMSSYSYLITQTTGFDPAKGSVLGKWLIYIACAGQREATSLGYSPMPPNLIAAVFGAEQRIPGAPPPPPIDAQHCPNPTLTGQAVPPPTHSGGAGPGSSSHGGTTSSAAGSAQAAPSSAGTTAAGTGGFGGSHATGATAVATMSAAQRAASFVLAEAAAARAVPPPSWPLLLVAGALLIAVLTPALVMRRHAD